MNPRPPTSVPASGLRSGFTLVELLTVIAIVGILSSLLFVTFSGVTAGARRAKTRVQFAQWATAMEDFRHEYGFYPLLADTLIDDAAKSKEFVEALSGRQIDGGLLSGVAPISPGFAAGNTKSIRFCSFGQDDLNAAGQLIDAFENPQIAVLIDTNFDGMIRIGAGPTDDYTESEVPAVSVGKPLATNGVVRAGVIFYSPGAGKSTTDIITSW